MLYKYTSLSLQIKTLTIINHNGSFSKKTQNYLTLKEPANIWFIYIYIKVCVNVCLYTHSWNYCKVCKVLLEGSLLSVHYLSSLNYSVASGKTNLGKENFQLKATFQVFFFPFFGTAVTQQLLKRLHTGCSTLFLVWLPAAVQHMAPSSWGFYFDIRTIQNVKLFPLQKPGVGQEQQGNLSSSASC